MDAAYDQINQSALSPEEHAEVESKPTDQASTLNKDFQEAYKAISSSPWGAKLGGFFGSVVKQGENVYKEAQQEFTAVSEEATKGFSTLQSQILSRTRGMSVATDSAHKTATETGTATDGVSTPEETEGMLARLQAEAGKRLKEIQKAEDAADEALLKFGTNIRNFLKDAVKVSPPSGSSSSATTFESKDASGKRVIHTTRFDAQMHVIHSSLDSFNKDPDSAEYIKWAQDFDVEKKTGDIAGDLEKYDELRSSMETLVPDQVAYLDFWKRYYFLRHSIETAEARRKDLLKASAGEAEEEVAWDDDSEDEEVKTPAKEEPRENAPRPASAQSSTTIQPSTAKAAAPAVQSEQHLKPSEPRKSHDEKSQADSDASYDVVGAASGAPSQAPGSPKEAKKAGEESEEEEDWE